MSTQPYAAITNLQSTTDVTLGEAYTIAGESSPAGTWRAVVRHHKRGRVTLATEAGDRMTVSVTALRVAPLPMAPPPQALPAERAVTTPTVVAGRILALAVQPIPAYATDTADPEWAVTEANGQPVAFGPERPAAVAPVRTHPPVTRLRSLLPLLLATVLASVGILVGAGSASAAEAPKPKHVSTFEHWQAEQTANRKCGHLEAYGESGPKAVKWERCVKRQYKRLTGLRMDISLGQACRKSTCGLLSWDAYASLLTRAESGAERVFPLKRSRFADMGVQQSAYHRTACRVYRYATEDHIRCTNGQVFKP